MVLAVIVLAANWTLWLAGQVVLVIYQALSIFPAKS